MSVMSAAAAGRRRGGGKDGGTGGRIGLGTRGRAGFVLLLAEKDAAAFFLSTTLPTVIVF